MMLAWEKKRPAAEKRKTKWSENISIVNFIFIIKPKKKNIKIKSTSIVRSKKDLIYLINKETC